MSTSNLYRLQAEDCLRMARNAQDERDKPFWLALAQSWLYLAEHSARGHFGLREGKQRRAAAVGFGACPERGSKPQLNPSALRASSQS